MRENGDHNNSEYGHFLRSVWGLILTGTYPERFIDWCMKIFIDETVVQKVADFIMLPHLSKLLSEINT